MVACAHAYSCHAALANPEAFWGNGGRTLNWSTPFTQVMDVSFRREDFRICWYVDGELNVSTNCLNGHLPANREIPAIIWDGDSPGPRVGVGRSPVPTAGSTYLRESFFRRLRSR